MQVCVWTQWKRKNTKQRAKEDYPVRRNVFKKLGDFMKGNKNSYLKKYSKLKYCSKYNL